MQFKKKDIQIVKLCNYHMQDLQENIIKHTSLLPYTKKKLKNIEKLKDEWLKYTNRFKFLLIREIKRKRKLNKLKKKYINFFLKKIYKFSLKRKAEIIAEAIIFADVNIDVNMIDIDLPMFYTRGQMYCSTLIAISRVLKKLKKEQKRKKGKK